MWLFTVYGFFSVVFGGEGDELMVRARKTQHLQRLHNRFPILEKYEIVHWKNRDYPCRIIVPRAVWSQVLVELNEEMTWNNFKDEAGRRHGNYSAYLNMLHKIWQLGFHFGGR